jgi:hypothetical protein
MAHVIDPLLSNGKVLSSNPSSVQKIKRKKGNNTTSPFSMIIAANARLPWHCSAHSLEGRT